MSDALSLSRSDLPEEIVEAIDVLTRAHEEAAADAGGWAVPRTQEIDTAYEALTAAILSRLGEAEAAEKELATLRRVHRWNVEHRDGEVLVCRNEHDKGEDCDWERFVPEERLTAALARVERLEKALEAMFTNYGPPGALLWSLEYPADHPITLARSALSEAPPQGEQ